MNATSPWLFNVNAKLNQDGLKPVYLRDENGYTFTIYNLNDSIWLVAAWPKGTRMGFRLAYSPDDQLTINKISSKNNRLVLKASPHKRLKANDSLKKIPVIFFSANSDIKELSAKAGAERYVAKPFNLEDLHGVIEETISVLNDRKG